MPASRSTAAVPAHTAGFPRIGSSASCKRVMPVAQLWPAPPQGFLAGDGWALLGDGLDAIAPERCDTRLYARAEDLIALAAFAWQRGEAVDAALAQPVYLRDQVAKPAVC